MPELNHEQSDYLIKTISSILRTNVRGENNATLSTTQDQSNSVNRPRHIKNVKDNHKILNKYEILKDTWHKKPKWKCEHCGRGYNIEKNLQKHVRQAHSVESPNEVAAEHLKSAHEKPHKKTKWNCEDCGKSYTRNENLKKHVAREHSVKKTGDEQFNKVAKQKSVLSVKDTQPKEQGEISRNHDAERMEEDDSDYNDSNLQSFTTLTKQAHPNSSAKNIKLNNSKIQGNRKVNVNYQHSQYELNTEQKIHFFTSLELTPDTSGADNESQSEALQRMQEDDTETINRDDKSEENEYYDKSNREVQTHVGTAVNNGAVENSAGDSLESSSNYVTLNDNMAILRGSFHQGDLRFKSSRDKQCTAIAAVACATFCALDPNRWSKSVNDTVLIIGDIYYNYCIAARTSPAAGEVNPEYLAVRDLLPTILYNGEKVAVNILEDSNYNGHIDNDRSTEGFPNLIIALISFFTLHACGILTANGKSVAVHYKAGPVGPTYWMFDSHSRGPEGAPALTGAACCMRFSHLGVLHSMLRRNLFESTKKVLRDDDLKNNLNVFSLTPLSFKPPN